MRRYTDWDSTFLMQPTKLFLIRDLRAKSWLPQQPWFASIRA